MALIHMLLSVLLAAATARAEVAAPSIRTDGDAIVVESSDLLLLAEGSEGGPAVSLKALALQVSQLGQAKSTLTLEVLQLRNELAALKGNMGPNATLDRFATREEMLKAVDGAVSGVKNVLLGAQEDATKEVNGRVDDLLEDISGLPEHERTVQRLAADMNYVLLHTANITKCGADGSVHLGDGECVSPVPTCEAPPKVEGGEVVVSSEYIIPGVTAKYTCTKPGTFLLGSTSRTCREREREFNGDTPRCPRCQVQNCRLCSGSATNCGLCEFGHDPSDDRTSCEERKDTVIIMGGRPPANNGHNYVEAELLAPNAEDWIGFLPKLPQQCTHGAAGMIRGVIYVVTAKIRYARSLHFFKIDPRATQWTTFAAMSDDAEKNKEGYFHGTAGSKLYIFGTLTSEVYDPDDDKWTVLPELPTSRSQGATAVVEYAKDTTTYAKIFCLGGAAGRPVNTVSIFDTATNEWSDGVRMNTPRKFHAAAAYNGLVIIAGGMDDTNIKLSSVEVFDIELEQWREKSPMIAGAWADFSSGPMPVLGGKLLLPSAHQNPNGASTRPAPGLEYDIETDSWAEGPSLTRMRGQYTIVVGTRT